MALINSPGKNTTPNSFCWEDVHLEKDKQNVSTQKYLDILPGSSENPLHSCWQRSEKDWCQAQASMMMGKIASSPPDDPVLLSISLCCPMWRLEQKCLKTRSAGFFPVQNKFFLILAGIFQAQLSLWKLKISCPTVTTLVQVLTHENERSRGCVGHCDRARQELQSQFLQFGFTGASTRCARGEAACAAIECPVCRDALTARPRKSNLQPRKTPLKWCNDISWVPLVESKLHAEQSRRKTPTTFACVTGVSTSQLAGRQGHKCRDK